MPKEDELGRLTLLLMTLVLALFTVSCGVLSEGTPRDAGLLDGSAPASLETRVTCIDVGKGDCILVEAGGMAVLVDTGYRDTAAKVLSCLAGRGIGHVDAIVLTHYDRDHVSGLRAIAESLDVDMVYLPSYKGSDKNYDTTMVTIGNLSLTTKPITKETRCKLGEADLTIYPSGVAYKPGTRGEEGNDNDASLVVALRCGDDSYLFAGDLEKEGVAAYLQANRGHYDVLKMPHHGECDGNTEALLDDVGPRIALITDSSDDPADKKTFKLLKKHDVEAYRTSIDGTIVVAGDGSGSYTVSTEND